MKNDAGFEIPPKDLSDPVAAARRMKDTKGVLFSPKQWRDTVVELLKIIDGEPGRTAAALRLDRSRR